MVPMIASAFTMGLLGSTHCVAMCGGVVSVLSSATPRSPQGAGAGTARPDASKPAYWLAYNAGRMASYTALGAVVGALGSLSSAILPLDVVRFGLRSLAAVAMLAVGLHLAGLPSLVKVLESAGAPLWKKLAPLSRRFLPLRSPLHALALGALWGFMPCGLLYGALALAASAESPTTGAATMFAFAAGTLPVMLTMSALADRVARTLARGWVRKTAGVVVLGFGVWSSVGLVRQLRAEDPVHTCCHHP
ncbi:Heavy-metal-associated domain protein [Labilithrix luteola]|uniref:Heavy-metal-associated domain protein n=2 Tax=Labilithrix luteola TaxID=1391654 RepID=A0A0K1Q467_9BACT|nr:Heavy-metal-associated domain protein [Labilithrix luteola]